MVNISYQTIEQPRNVLKAVFLETYRSVKFRNLKCATVQGVFFWVIKQKWAKAELLFAICRKCCAYSLYC